MAELSKSGQPVKGHPITFSLDSFPPGCIMNVFILEEGKDPNKEDNWKPVKAHTKAGGLEMTSMSSDGKITFKVIDDNAAGIVRVQVVCGGELAFTVEEPISDPPDLFPPVKKDCTQGIVEMGIKTVIMPITLAAQGVTGILWIVGAFFGDTKFKGAFEWVAAQYP